VIAYLDLTSLTGQETEEDVVALCRKAHTPKGDVAAVCVYGEWAGVCARELDTIAVAAVANFPAGDRDAERARRESAQAVAAGAREIDVVLPWRAWLAGDREGALEVVAAARGEAPVLKVILESAQLGDRVKEAARDALQAGADFVKTSTGKAGPGATPEAARAMLEAVREHGSGGLKASGGVRTVAQAREYLDLAVEHLGEVGPDRFRIGASGLLDELLK